MAQTPRGCQAALSLALSHQGECDHPTATPHPHAQVKEIQTALESLNNALRIPQVRAPQPQHHVQCRAREGAREEPEREEAVGAAAVAHHAPVVVGTHQDPLLPLTGQRPFSPAQPYLQLATPPPACPLTRAPLRLPPSHSGSPTAQWQRTRPLPSGTSPLRKGPSFLMGCLRGGEKRCVVEVAWGRRAERRGAMWRWHGGEGRREEVRCGGGMGERGQGEALWCCGWAERCQHESKLCMSTCTAPALGCAAPPWRSGGHWQWARAGSPYVAV